MNASAPPRHGPPLILRAIVGLLVLGGGGVWWAASQGYITVPGVAASVRPVLRDTQVAATGTIESETSTLAAEIAGRLVAVTVREGDTITVGTALARIDDPLVTAQVDQARAALAVAEASLANLRAGTRLEEIRGAVATRDLAQAQLDGARRALRSAEAIRAQPQDLDARLNQARLAVEVARLRLAQLESGGRAEEIATAQAIVDVARVRLAQLEAGGREDEVRGAQATLDIARTRLAQLEAGGRTEDLVAAGAQLETAQLRLAQLNAGARTEERTRANAVVGAATHAVVAAENRVAQVLAGPRAGDVASAQAAVDQAETRLEQTRTGTPRAEDVAQARLAWEAADAAYISGGQSEDDARAVYDQAQHLRDNRPATLSADQANLTFAQAQQGWHAAQATREQRRVARDVARVAYDRALAGPTSWERRLAEEAVAQARAQLVRVQDVSAYDVTAARVALDVARDQLVQAEASAQAIASPTDFDRAIAALGVTASSAQRDKLATATPFDIDAARATVAQAEAALNLRRQPATERDLEVARLTVRQAEEALAIRRQPATDRDLDIARLAVRQAEVLVRDLETQRADPLVATAQVEAAQTQVAVAEANIAGADARLDLARNGATSAQLTVSEAQVAQARAAVRVLEAQIGKGTIVASRNGTIRTIISHVGEAVAPGTPLLTWHDPSDLTLTAYVAETMIGRVRADQAVSISVDSFPGERFPGTIRTIATQAEFTPRNTQVAKDRVNLVFAVKIAIDSANGRLRAGMPADAIIELEKVTP